MTGRLRWSMAGAAVLAVVLVASLLLRTGAGPSAPAGPPVSGSTAPPAPGSTAPPAPGSTAPPVVGAAITLTVAVAPPNIRTLHVQGTGFGADETVDLQLNGRATAQAHADAGGAFVAIIHLPTSGSDFTVRAVGATSGRGATATARL